MAVAQLDQESWRIGIQPYPSLLESNKSGRCRPGNLTTVHSPLPFDFCTNVRLMAHLPKSETALAVNEGGSAE